MKLTIPDSTLIDAFVDREASDYNPEKNIIWKTNARIKIHELLKKHKKDNVNFLSFTSRGNMVMTRKLTIDVWDGRNKDRHNATIHIFQDSGGGAKFSWVKEREDSNL